MDNMELNPEQMNEVVGGRNEGGYERRPREKAGCFIYKIRRGDNLTNIARDYDTTVRAIMRVNPELENQYFSVAGCYIYIPD